MYESYWNLEANPFTSSQDARFFFYSSAHEKGLLELLHAIDHELGISLLLGAGGTGKTFLTRLLALELAGRGFAVVRLGSLGRCQESFLGSVAAGLDLQADAKKGFQILQDIESALIQAQAEGGAGCVVLVDEVPLGVSPEIFQAVRLLQDLEVCSGFPLHVTLVGRPELREDLEGSLLDGRIGISAWISGLAMDEVSLYLRHRLMQVGGGRDLFSLGAIESLHRATGGTPLALNRLADRSLLLGYQRQVDLVDADLVEEAVTDAASVSVSHGSEGETRDLYGIHFALLERSGRRSSSGSETDQPVSASESVRSSVDGARAVAAKDEAAGAMKSEPSEADGGTASEIAGETVEGTEVAAKHSDAESSERSLDEILDALLPGEGGSEVPSDVAPKPVSASVVGKLEIVPKVDSRTDGKGERRSVQDGINSSESEALRDCLIEEDPLPGLGEFFGRWFGGSE